MPDRLQKIIARAGITSRRKAEQLITSGRVTVNGEVIRQLGSRADPASDRICVDGKVVDANAERRYLVMYKPKACITSTSDPEGRTTVMDLLGPHASKGLFPVGRLDYHSEGLLLLTDDGDLANRVLSAKNGIPKTYEVKISGQPSRDAIQKLRAGTVLDGRFTRPENIRLLKLALNPWYEITLVAGRNRQIHRMFQRIGFLVEKIRRVSIGGLTLGGLEPRQVRELSAAEIERVLHKRPSTRRVRSGVRQNPRPVKRSRATSPGGRRNAGPRRAPRARRSGPPRSRRRHGRNDRPTSGFKRSGRLRRSPGRRPAIGGRSPARGGKAATGRSRGRNPRLSQGRRSSRPGSRARP